MGYLFDTSSDNIGLHLKNIFKEEELQQDSVTEEFSVTAEDGKNYRVKHYNLDAIIAVGYRDNAYLLHFRTGLRYGSIFYPIEPCLICRPFFIITIGCCLDNLTQHENLNKLRRYHR